MQILNNYSELKEAGITDKGPCTVMTWANVFKCSPRDAKEWLIRFGYKSGRGGMTTEQVENAMKAVKKSTVVEGPYTRYNRISLQKFVEKHKEGRYYVLVRGHALAVIDGVVYDHTEKPRREVVRAFRVYLGREGGYKAYKESK